MNDHVNSSGESRSILAAWPARILLVALAYALSGKLSLLLNTPLNPATAIFPPTGIATAALLIWGSRLWPGVLLGALTLNGWNLWNSAHGVDAMSLGVITAISAGSTLQALAAAWLVRRHVGFPTALSHERDIIRFFLLAGPVACVIAAFIGPATLWIAGMLDAAGAIRTAWTWWLGDTVGTLLLVPMLFSFSAEPATAWRGRRLTMTLPMLLLILLVILAYLRINEWEKARIDLEFHRQTDQLTNALVSNFSGHFQNIKALERYFNSSELVSRDEFRNFTHETFEEYPGIQALEWVPRVAESGREAFEQAVRREQEGNEFRIREPQAKGMMVPAQRRAEYFPVHYVEPLAGNEKVLGFDLASDSSRKEALDLSRDTGRMVATDRITLLQDQQGQFGILISQPVYIGGEVPGNVEQRRRLLKGFTLGVFRIGDMVHSALAGENVEGIQLLLLDEGAPEGERELMVLPEEHAKPHGFGLASTYPIDMASRHWVIHYTGSLDFLKSHNSGYPAITLAAGLVTSSLFALFLLVLTGRTSRIEEQVQQRTNQLRDSESRMNAIVESAVEAIIIIDDQGIIESVNIAATRLFGYEAAEMVGRNVNMLMPPPHRESHDLYLHRYRKTGVAHIVGGAREVEGLHRDGTRVPLELSVSDVRLAGRRIFTGILHDLTERKKMDRMKNEFVSTVSHELRTPLTSIQGSLGLIKGGVAGELPPKALSLIDVAHRNCDRLVRLINDILDLEKIEAGKLVFDLRVLEVAPLVHQALESNKAYAEKFGVTLTLAGTLPEVFASVDEDRLAQVLANLLSNAAKFSPHGKQVEITMTRDQGWLSIAVRDHGSGIPASFRDKLFSKFSQADSGDTRKTGGTGLGLAICKSIMERMGGNIEFREAESGGAVFRINLPEFGHQGAWGTSASNGQTRSLGRILICEDEADIARLLSMMLAGEGYESDLAPTAVRAKELLAERSYQAMTLDLVLPDMNGLSLLREVRDNPETADLPVIVVSAWLDRFKERVEGNALRVSDWLNKPLDGTRLKQAISRACARLPGNARILYVEDDHSLVGVVSAVLGPLASVDAAHTLAQAREKLDAGEYDLMLLDLVLPDGDGITLLSHLHDRMPDTPVVIFSSCDVTQEVAREVNTVLLKSATSNDQLLENIRKLLNKSGPETVKPGGEGVDATMGFGGNHNEGEMS